LSAAGTTPPLVTRSRRPLHEVQRQRGRGSERASARERCAADEADAGGGGAEAVEIGGTGVAGADGAELQKRWAWLVRGSGAGRQVAKRGGPAPLTLTGRVGRRWLRRAVGA
jgi:hypothetical protein